MPATKRTDKAVAILRGLADMNRMLRGAATVLGPYIGEGRVKDWHLSKSRSKYDIVPQMAPDAPRRTWKVANDGPSAVTVHADGKPYTLESSESLYVTASSVAVQLGAAAGSASGWCDPV